MQGAAFDRSDLRQLQDLQRRLEHARLVAVPRTPGASGIDPDRLRAILQHWRTRYSWPDQEARISALPWQRTAATEIPVRAIVAPATEDAPVLLLLHGWPDSVLRFTRVLPRLADVTAVVPALPGFPFAAPVPEGGMSAVGMADAIVAAMAEFGYDRFTISAGDVGCDVAEPAAVDPASISPDEQRHVDQVAASSAADGGDERQQMTRPITLGYALSDSPIGLLARMLEEYHDRTERPDDQLSGLDEDLILTGASLYWFGACTDRRRRCGGGGFWTSRAPIDRCSPS